MKTTQQTGDRKLSELSVEVLKTELKKQTVILLFFSIILEIMLGANDQKRNKFFNLYAYSFSFYFFNHLEKPEKCA